MSDANEEDSHVPAYTPSKKVTVDELMKQDAEDESLRKYKEALLGKAVSGPSDDPRKLVIKEMKIVFEDRAGGNEITYPLDTPELIQAMKEKPFVIKEKCHYKIVLTFKIQHDIVSGLKQINTVYRKGLRVSKEETMLGSFAPQAATHSVSSPRHGWEEAPSGILARGSYTAKVVFVDDDKNEHLSVEYGFSIKSDWKSDE
ncbi:hypothetical protein DICPUDRAFT_95353 [Dictyostelium purpureum]|uniref:Rho GDP-dissociation inhibitor n=1 Tax=Dictyostelium purpureum TaxID=5786 RepID=F0ZVE2_DICPU|nr:uncharacterized protein DICPUDRAFT_95353 [Dictyostelium purpureum]EGC32091.1 hypothetical protein DICPUDRAFT_95353 [Dictyostelium purpureum]|eukprot:XP_003291380.1 hypothetical protein DICPUDRAFT_95353 [Dictyostelium purpureum]